MTNAPLAAFLSALLVLPAPAFALAPPPASPAADPSTMSDEDKVARAKVLFGEGDAALQAGDPATALAKFEEAYNVYAPNIHVFNFNIGTAAYELKDCVKAKTAFQRFLDLVPEHPARGDAQGKLLEIERSGCAAAAPEPVPVPVEPTGPTAADNEDAPELTSKRSAREDAIDEEIEEKESKKVGPLLITGSILTGLGVAGLIGGAVSIALANKKAKDLAGLASPGPTGFPEGDYAEDNVFDLDRNKLPANNATTIAMFTAGGVLTAVGVALIAVHFSKKKNKTKANAMRSHGGPRLGGLGAGPLRGGAGAGATVHF
jgi:hypothetical protein